MGILFWGFALFVLAFFSHFVLWKIRLPKRQVKTILQFFFAVLFVGIFVLWKFSFTVTFFNIPLPVGLLEYFHISLFFVSMTASYIITYTALEADSPTIVMLLYIDRAGLNGISKNEFEQSMNDDVLVKPRIKDLLKDKMVFIDINRYRLTSKGILLAKIFILYRKLLKFDYIGG